jgi:hypothetical protein
MSPVKDNINNSFGSKRSHEHPNLEIGNIGFSVLVRGEVLIINERTSNNMISDFQFMLRKTIIIILNYSFNNNDSFI